MRHLLLRVSLFAALVARPGAAQSAGGLLAPLLPSGPVEAEILELWSSPRFVALTSRIQQAAKADPTWWRSHVQQAQPGTPLPYDSRMGVTEPEYRELLTLADSVKMRPVRTVQLQLQSASGGWLFPADGPIEAIRGIEIDTIGDLVRTPFGVLATRSAIRASDGQKATGRWAGPQWKLENLDQATVTGTVATFAVGRLEATGQTLIYFDAKEAASGQITRRASMMVRLARF